MACPDLQPCLVAIDDSLDQRLDVRRWACGHKPRVRVSLNTMDRPVQHAQANETCRSANASPRRAGRLIRSSAGSCAIKSAGARNRNRTASNSYSLSQAARFLTIRLIDNIVTRT
jgi:hypothetical protein